MPPSLLFFTSTPRPAVDCTNLPDRLEIGDVILVTFPGLTRTVEDVAERGTARLRPEMVAIGMTLQLVSRAVHSKAEARRLFTEMLPQFAEAAARAEQAALDLGPVLSA